MRGQMRWTWLAILTAVALCAPRTTFAGGDKKTFEKNLDAGLREVINHGATIFNQQGDYAGCYRVFEGALQAVKPLLTSYPELQKKIEAGLASASQMPTMHDRAHALRKVLQEVRLTINPDFQHEQAPKKVEDKKDKEGKKQAPADPNVARAKGVVKIAGQTLTHGYVTFVNPAGQRFSANVQPDGSFIFRKGFPPGAYVVVIENASAQPAPGEKRLAIPASYADPATSPVRFTAIKGDNTFDLNLTAK